MLLPETTSLTNRCDAKYGNSCLTLIERMQMVKSIKMKLIEKYPTNNGQERDFYNRLHEGNI